MVIRHGFDRAAFAQELRKACGFGTYFYVGGDAVDMVGALRKQLLDARGDCDGAEACHAVILDLRDGASALTRHLEDVAKHEARYLIVISDFAGAFDVAAREREALEKQVISGGYRKISAYYDFNPYEALNAGAGLHVAPFERVPNDALKRYNLEVLEEERLLHTDMAREAGRRSDAHCVRYRKAADYIRPGDSVLDVACGLGYGSRLMFEASEARSVHGVDLSDFGVDYAKAHYGVEGRVTFSVGDAEKLEDIPDSSFDFIAAFETIEHVPHPEHYLQQLKRVLKPGGRVMVCAPNDWTDETGRDPNPHHLHVYEWKRLKSEIEGHFLIEKAFVQVAGGAMKCHFSPRSWTEVDPDQPDHEEAEWLVFLGMKDPLEPGNAEFVETVWKLPQSARFNVSAFARDYLNPWIVKAMVAIGMRAQSAKLLARFRRQVLASTPDDSVDHGAALCGALYDLIEQGDFAALPGLMPQVDGYIAIRAPSPHQRRWQVSLAYAAGMAAWLDGDSRSALKYLDICIGIDPVPFSPILGNKTLDALCLKAVMMVTQGNILGARTALIEAVALPRRWTSSSLHNSWHRSWLNTTGLDDAPLPFGFAEMAMVFDKASRAAYLLSTLDSAKQRPAAFAREAEGFLERQISQLRADLVVQERAGEERAREMALQNERIQELAREVVAQSDSAQALALEVAGRDQIAQQLAQQVRDLDAHAQDMAKNLLAEIESRDAIIADLLKRGAAIQGDESVP